VKRVYSCKNLRDRHTTTRLKKVMPGAPLKSSMLKCVLTDVHFWVPVIVLALGSWLLIVFAVAP